MVEDMFTLKARRHTDQLNNRLTRGISQPFKMMFWWKVDLGRSIIFEYAKIYIGVNCSNPFLLCSKCFMQATFENGW